MPPSRHEADRARLWHPRSADATGVADPVPAREPAAPPITREPLGPGQLLGLQRSAGNSATASLISRWFIPEILMGSTSTREDLRTAVTAGEEALKADGVDASWKDFTEVAKERVRRLQQLLADYQQTELYAHVKLKNPLELMQDKLKDDLVDLAGGIPGLILDTTVGVAEAHADVEAAKKVLAKQRQNMRKNDKIGMDGLEDALDGIFDEAGGHLKGARLEGEVQTWTTWGRRVLGRGGDDTAELKGDDVENLESLQKATEKLTQAQKKLGLAANELHHRMNAVEAKLKGVLLDARTKRLAKEGGRLEVYVATYWKWSEARGAQDELDEVQLYGWTIKGIQHDNEIEGANEALVLLLGDGFNWRRAPLEKWLVHVAFDRIEGRPTPMHVNTQKIKYGATNEEIGRDNAPTSGEFEVPRQVRRKVMFQGLTGDLAGRVPAVVS